MFSIIGTGRSRLQQLTLIIVAVFSLFVIYLSSSRLLQSRGDDSLPNDSVSPILLPTDSKTADEVWTKPTNIRIVGLVFFGRRDRVEVLNCYLQRNLVLNGGWLDEVQWVENTEKKEDLEYLNTLLASHPGYRKLVLNDHTYEKAYENAWGKMEPGVIYVKIDDDVVWLADDTIPRMVQTKLEHPEYVVVSANMINSPLMGWLHYHVGAIHPYLPEILADIDTTMTARNSHDVTSKARRRTPWRFSDYPYWEGSDDFVFTYDQDPPAPLHRWLRIPASRDTIAAALNRTPIKDAEYSTWGNSLQSWAIAAQQHYSLLENIEKDQLHMYKFASPDSTWITNYNRLSINLIALNSSDILSNLPMDAVDEEWITVNLPKKIGKSVAVQTHALAAHYSFAFQTKLGTTDLLSRYLDYAQERICSART